jgi:hypothetical protein
VTNYSDTNDKRQVGGKRKCAIAYGDVRMHTIRFLPVFGSGGHLLLLLLLEFRFCH